MKKINIIWIILTLIALLIGLGYLYVNERNKFNETIQDRDKLEKALGDTVAHYVNERGELVAEKRTLQSTVETLEDDKYKLTVSQDKLLNRVKEVEKENHIINAALITMQVEIDSLRTVAGVIDTTDKTITFNRSDKDVQFNALVGNVLPFKNKIPFLDLKNLTLPNEQFIEFHWEKNKNEGYPISFSVTNTNLYFNTYNIDSYAIPELQKPTIKPNGWGKVKIWLGDNWGKMVVGGLCGGAGYILGSN